jgi:hypothetical protein
LGAVFFSVAGIHDGFQGNFSNASICDSSSASGTCTPNPGFFRFPDVLNSATNASVGSQNFFTANQRNKKDPYSIQWNFSFERELFRNTALRISYIANRANQLTWSPNLNQQLPTTAPFTLPDGSPNPNPNPVPFPLWKKVRIRAGGAISTYESMQTELIHKYSNGLTLQSTWTWAKNLTDVESWPRSGFSGEITGDKMNQYDMHGDYGDPGGRPSHRKGAALPRQRQRSAERDRRRLAAEHHLADSIRPLRHSIPSI